MSVFQLQEWWSVKISQDEEFDWSCFGIGNIDNVQPANNKIVVGSLQGILRVYYPARPNYRVEDLVLEENLGKPILQVLIGRFIPGSEQLGIAVLHPRELVVYEVIPTMVREDRVSYYNLRKVYQHELGIDGKHFTAFNMIAGPFGGVRKRDLILVQSIDGKLQIFEQSAHAFSRQLLDCLIPGPLKYIPKIDAFVTVNYAGIAECYRYQVLASSQADVGIKSDSKTDDPMGSFGLRGIRSSLVEWSVNLGENCRDILLGNFSISTEQITDSFTMPSSANELLMICDKSMFLVKADTGGVIQQRKLDRADASCGCVIPYNNDVHGPFFNFLLAGTDSTVQVFSGFNLTWAAKLLHTPVHMEVGAFGSMQGLIVAIDDTGYLSVNYLGTKPPVQAVLTQVRDLDYDKIDEEHRQLLQIIRDSQNDAKVEQVEKLLIKSQVSKSLDLEYYHVPDMPIQNLVPIHPPSSAMHHSHTSDAQYVKIAVRLYFSYAGHGNAQNVSVSISTPSNLHVSPRNFTLPKVSNTKSTPIVMKIYIFALKTFLPTNGDIVISATYQHAHRSDLHTCTHHIPIPLSLMVRPKAPSKSATYKLILDTEFPAVPLTELFGDLLYAYQQAGYLDNIAENIGANAVQAMGFQYFSTPSTTSNNMNNYLVSILVSKNAGRYRIQANSYELLSLMSQELTQRLTVKLSQGNNPSTSNIVKFNDVLPLDEYFAVIHSHLITRIRLVTANAQLNDAAHQYRLIEKRLLGRFKDRNPTPLHGLDLLLKESYDRIITFSDEISQYQTSLAKLKNDIDTFSRLMALLITLKFNLSPQDSTALQSYLCPELTDGMEQGWEEMVHAALSHLLKTTLGKNAKESTSLNTSNLEMPKSIDALKKSFMLVVDRLEKGGKIVLATAANPAAVPSSANNTSSAPPSNSASTKSSK